MKKSVKRWLSFLLAVLLLLGGVLPGDKITIVRADEEVLGYTVYFDPGTESLREIKVSGALAGTGDTEDIFYPMNASEKYPGLYEYTFEEPYPYITFTGESENGETVIPAQHLEARWDLKSPCYTIENDETDPPKTGGIWRDLADDTETEKDAAGDMEPVGDSQTAPVSLAAGRSQVFTPEETEALVNYMGEHPDRILLETEAMYEQCSAWSGQTLYLCNFTQTLNNDWNQRFIKSVTPSDFPAVLQSKKLYAWDVPSWFNSSDQVAFMVNLSDANPDNHWNTIPGYNKTDYYKTQVLNLSSLKGKVFWGSGIGTGSGTDDNGTKYFEVSSYVFPQSPLSGKTVYVDTAQEATGLAAPPKIKIVSPSGTVVYKEMTLCGGETSIYRYTFPDFVLQDTGFQFTDASQSNGTPAENVTAVDHAAPLWDGTSWTGYTSKLITIHVKSDLLSSANILIHLNKTGGGTEQLTINSGNPSFTFDSSRYSGFWLEKEGNNGATGNRSELQSVETILEKASRYGMELTAAVAGWTNNGSSQRKITWSRYATGGDASLNIPEGNFKREQNCLYVNSTFYDYYSDVELGGNNRNTVGTPDSNNASNDKIQARTFNKSIANYFQGTSLASCAGANSTTWTYQSPLYFGEFYGSDSYQKELLNFQWNNNSGNNLLVNSQPGARQGLVNRSLKDGRLVMGTDNVLAPYFDENFLRGGNNTGDNLGYVFPDVQFPFVKNSNGYWEFDSSKSDQTLRMKTDTDGSYFLDRVGASNAVYGVYGDLKPTTNSNFFPFNDAAESKQWGKLNYAFGVRLDIPFYMTKDGTVEMDGVKKDITYNFSGDDDVWIFIDDQLVLDIGGDHSRVEGEINFSTRKATTTTLSTSGTNVNGANYTFDSGLVDSNKQHTLTMFYMERGLWESNMKVTFNFPQANELEVEKEVAVPGGVNSIFAAAVEKLKTSVNFPVTLKNKVTSGGKVDGSGTQDAVDTGLAIDGASLAVPKTGAVGQTGQYGGGRSGVVKYSYPGSRKPADGQSVTDQRVVNVAVTPETAVTNASADRLKNEGSLQFDVYADSSTSASDPFVALVDGSGHRIGGWASGAVYEGTSAAMGSRSWKTIRVYLHKLKSLDGGSSFDYTNIEKVQIAYWNNTTIYLDGFRLYAPPAVTGSGGFTKDQNTIPDYGSYDSSQLESVNGAEYAKTDQTGTRSQEIVESGVLYLKDRERALFADQFRRESYLGIREECDTGTFDVSWTVSEEGQLKASGAGVAVDDGRVEDTPENPGSTKPDESTLLFKTFDSGAEENVADFFKLNVKYVNTLKTGSLAITKQLREGQTDPGDQYTFKVTFSNVAGMDLEGDTPIQELTKTIAVGETWTISGIPAGTYYTIQEVRGPGDEFSLDKVLHGNDREVTFDPNTLTVSGSVVADADDGDRMNAYSFYNDVNPSVTVNGTKQWVVPEGMTLPESVTLALQRKLAGADDSTYETALDMDGQPVPEKLVTNESDWAFTFSNVPKYNPDRTAYVYRVVETMVGGKPVDKTVFTWEGGTVAGDTYDVTNTYNPKTDLKLTKTDAADTSRFLEGAVFKLERLTQEHLVDAAWPSAGTVLPDGIDRVDGGGISAATDASGIIRFADLPDGTYRITETKAPAGYSLLKAPVELVINRAEGCTIKDGDGQAQEITVDEVTNTISVTISNRLMFELPDTGGYGNIIMILGGLALAAAVLLMYILRIRGKRGRRSVN